MSWLESTRADALLEAHEGEFAERYDALEVIRLEGQGKHKIQRALNELRDLIVNAAEAGTLTQEHENRLLKRLEALQREFNKQTPDLRRALGQVAEISAVVRTFGQDLEEALKPIGKIVRVISDALRLAHGLPPGPTFLALPDAETSDPADTDGHVTVSD